MNPHAALDALVCGYHAALRKQKTLVFMEYKPVNSEATHGVYVDESGGSKTDQILLLSACVDIYSNWTKFSDDWYAVLQAPPTINAFHVRDARSRSGEFRGWKTADVNRKVASLTEILLSRDRDLHVVTVWTSEKDYKEIVRPYAVPDIKHAYFMCFMTILLGVAAFQDLRGIDTPADFLFDDKGDIGLEALLWYPAIKEGAKPELSRILGGTPAFRSDERVLPLQAADLVAWHKRRQKEFGYSDFELAASAGIDTIPSAETQITRSSLEAMADGMAKIPGVKEAQALPSGYKQLKSQRRKLLRRSKDGGSIEEKS